MKTIILIRHAKSSWKFPELKDIDRPLNERGLNDAPIMGKVLKDLEMIPDLIISSPAVRAMSTAKMMANELNYLEQQIATSPKLYLEPESKLLKVIKKTDDKFNTLFIIGHNPGLTDLANDLAGTSIDNIPTAGVFGIQFENDTWSEIKKGKGKNIFFEVPKKYRNKIEESEKQVL